MPASLLPRCFYGWDCNLFSRELISGLWTRPSHKALSLSQPGWPRIHGWRSSISSSHPHTLLSNPRRPCAFGLAHPWRPSSLYLRAGVLSWAPCHCTGCLSDKFTWYSLDALTHGPQTECHSRLCCHAKLFHFLVINPVIHQPPKEPGAAPTISSSFPPNSSQLHLVLSLSSSRPAD